jgi:hypothetical protein
MDYWELVIFYDITGFHGRGFLQINVSLLDIRQEMAGCTFKKS